MASVVKYFDAAGCEVPTGKKIPALAHLFNRDGKDLGSLYDRAYHTDQANLDEAGEYSPYEKCMDEYDAYVEG